MKIRLLAAEHADEAARVHRISFDDSLPWLSGLHTPEQDRDFFSERVFHDCRVFGAFEADRLVGFIAFRQEWIDQLYVLPDAQGRGVGTALLAAARAEIPELSLWTFQKNLAARRFYERNGFVAVEESDGSRNDEQEPDVRYLCGASR